MDVDEFNESQKTVYILKKRPHKRQKLTQSIVANEGVPINNPRVPLLRLLQGQEPLENLELRYDLFNKSIQRQDSIAKSILEKTSDQIFLGISNIINNQVTPKKADCALLVSSASSTSSSNFTSQLSKYLTKNNNNKVIRLSAKECHTIKIGLKKIVSSILNDSFVGEDGHLVNDSDDDIDSEDEEELGNLQQRKLPFDLDAVEEWCEQSFLKKRENIKTTDIRIVLIFEDTDSFNLGLLNEFIRLINIYTDRIPFKMIFNIGTSVKSFGKKIDNDLSHNLKFHQFKIEQTNSILNTIVSKIILEDDFLVGNESVNVLLKRFETSIRDINDFLKNLKFLKMVYFFNNPLCIIASSYKSGMLDSELSAPYLDALRMLPSFENHITNLLSADNVEPLKIMKLLESNQALQQIISQSTNDYLKNLKLFKIVFKFLTDVLLKFAKIEGNYLIFYSILTNKDELIKNRFINEIVLSLKKLENDDLSKFLQEIDEFAQNDDLVQSLNIKIKSNVNFKQLDEALKDPEYSKIQYKIEHRKLLEKLVSLIENFIKNSYRNPFEMLFNECFQYNSHEVLGSNLTPQVRTIIEDSLTNPELYINTRQLTDSPVDRLNSKLNPIIAELFQIYRETNLGLNIYDFYEVFKNSLRREEIMKDLNEILDSKDNILENHLNDELRFKFIYQFFNDVDITDEAKWEKLTLVLFLQKCGELIDIGFCKQIKRKGDSLEKCIWRGL